MAWRYFHAQETAREEELFEDMGESQTASANLILTLGRAAIPIWSRANGRFASNGDRLP